MAFFFQKLSRSGARVDLRLVILCALLVVTGTVQGGETNDFISYGPLLSRFPLTLDVGERTEAMGPLFYDEQKESQRTFSFPPFYTHVTDPEANSEEKDIIYPLLTYDRFGSEYRWQLFQLLSFAGGREPSETMVRRFTLFPIYFQQRSADTNQNYTALVPFYGHLKHRLFHDDIRFIMFPIYARTEKKGTIIDNYVYPFVDVRHGDQVTGGQFWPFHGRETKGITYRTNGFGETELIPGHERTFTLWPFYMRATEGIGTDNVQRQEALLPFYSKFRSPLRDSTTVLWPFITWTDDREKKYHETDVPWPLIVFAHGEGKTIKRVFPLYSHAHSDTAESDFYLWPVYKFNRLHTGPLDRTRTRILLFLYSAVEEKNTDTSKSRIRHDFWPFYLYRKDFNGNTRVQVLAPLEPFVPNSKSIDRSWSPLWSFWRRETNPNTGVTSRSLFWNFYRSETAPGTRKGSLFFGLLQYQSDTATRRWGWFHAPAPKPESDHVSEYR